MSQFIANIIITINNIQKNASLHAAFAQLVRTDMSTIVSYHYGPFNVVLQFKWYNYFDFPSISSRKFYGSCNFNFYVVVSLSEHLRTSRDRNLKLSSMPSCITILVRYSTILCHWFDYFIEGTFDLPISNRHSNWTPMHTWIFPLELNSSMISK